MCPVIKFNGRVASAKWQNRRSPSITPLKKTEAETIQRQEYHSKLTRTYGRSREIPWAHRMERGHDQ